MTDVEVRFASTVTRLDRATTFLERPLRRTAGARFNPLPHAGTISTFLLVVVFVSGAYLTLFFSFGYAASYESVADMEGHVIQRIVRALHRYSSAMLVLTTLVHGWRMFVGQRFTGRARRWRWLTGVLALTLVWVAGVTGYWLVWDRRAAAISEATVASLGWVPGVEGLAVRHLLGHSSGTGAGTLFGIWLIHLGLSAVLAWAAYRHLRGTKLPSFPPREAMVALGVTLVAASILVPVGMLGPARPDEMVADMPLDPFVLFLLPLLLGPAGRMVVPIAMLLLFLTLALPRFLRRSDPLTPSVDATACTGCELCMLDCPYDAIEMTTAGERSVARIDEGRCVGCGICIGSCAFDAIPTPGDPRTPSDVLGHSVVVACDRQVRQAPAGDGPTIRTTCAGMLAPSAYRAFHDRGAADVLLVGCPPGDCRYGVGAKLARERLSGERVPHPSRLAASIVRTTLEREPEAPSKRPIVGAAVIVALSVLAVVAATSAPFTTNADAASLRLLVDHRAGEPLIETGTVAGSLSPIEVLIDDVLLESVEFDQDGGEIGFRDWLVPAGAASVLVRSSDEVLFEDRVAFGARSRFVVSITDAPPAPGAEAGRSVFTSRAAGCDVCHSVEFGDDGIGPSLAGIASVADERVPGLDAENYIRQSILLPDQFVLDGWTPGQMLPIYRDRLAAEELESLIDYLLTLERP